MELDYNTKKTYIGLLAEVLKKKSEVLNNLISLTQQQEHLIAEDDFDDDQFLELVSNKEKEIQALNQLDTGFDRMYEGVKEELSINKELYKKEITELKRYISDITDASVQLQTMEQRNKAKIELLFSQKRKNIKMGRMSNRSVANYYKAMSQQQDGQSYFYDKKN